ncbi:MAG: ATP-binding protein [Melioribacteraceae bacterium]|jgi:chemotaxis family two-component system sensor kinase Cph1|nr:ATP-binding protein [Melioribacteraceae bacterium]
MKPNEDTNTIHQIKKYAFILIAIWSILIGISMVWNYIQNKDGAILSASEAARTQFSMDVLSRRWNTEHGGVYVPVSEVTQPNPYLANVPERDIETPSGKKLTLINPAFMTRQIHELGFKVSNIRGHITSLNPIRTENSADEWETEALKKFEKNVKEVASVEMLNDELYLRLMKPLITEEGCMKCHQQQGYKIGDIRGGISSSVPMKPYIEIANNEIFNLFLWHGVLWAFGIIFLGFGTKQIIKNAKEREKLNIKLRETDERLKLAIEGTREGIWDWYVQTGVTYFNKRSAEIIGYALEELDLKKIEGWNFYSHPDDLENSNELLERLFLGEIEFYEFESRMKHKSGEWVWVLHRGKIVEWDNNGKPIRMTGTHTDITERKTAQEEIAKYVEELQMAHDTMEQTARDLVQLNVKLEESEKGLLESNANKDKFFSIISHDLKSPFNGILGITEMLVSDYDELTSYEIKEMIQVLRNVSVNVYDLLEGLLEWAKTQTDRMEYEFKSIDFYKSSSKIIDLLKITALQKNIFIKNGVKENTLIFADEKATETVLRNLIANAIKFTKPDGIIKIETEMRDDEIAISVSDSGIGMSEENRNKLFKIEVHHTTVGTNNEAGTGVGLILCKELVEKHSGKIWAESELGIGSKFVFTLPSMKFITLG